MAISILLIIVIYGFNPTYEKTTSVRYLGLLRTNFYSRFDNQAEK